MNRRSFLTSTVAATTAAGATRVTTARAADTASGIGRQKLLSWRHYECPSAAKLDLVLRFLEDAAIPARTGWV